MMAPFDPSAWISGYNPMSYPCPIESGQMLELADCECVHGWMPTRRHPFPSCGCWPKPKVVR